MKSLCFVEPYAGSYFSLFFVTTKSDKVRYRRYITNFPLREHVLISQIEHCDASNYFQK